MSEAFTPTFDAAYSLTAVCCFTAVGRVFVASAFALAADSCALVASAFVSVADLGAFVASAFAFAFTDVTCVGNFEVHAVSLLFDLGLRAVVLGLCGAVSLCASTEGCAVAFSLGHTVAIDVGWAVTVAVGCADSCIFVTSACAFTIAVPMLTGDCSSASTFADGCASAAARSALAPTFADLRAYVASAVTRVGAWDIHAAFGITHTTMATFAGCCAPATADSALVTDFGLYAVSLRVDFGSCTVGCAVGLGAGSCAVGCAVGLSPCTISLR